MLNEYQDRAALTANPTAPTAIQFMDYGLGIAGEAGEVADMLKKHLAYGKTLDRERLAKELGDVLWYVARLADVIGYPLSTVAQMNIDKLNRRYPEGFTQQAAQNHDSE